MGNFAVSTNRTVKLVDAEQVLVVDLTESNVTGSNFYLGRKLLKLADISPM